MNQIILSGNAGSDAEVREKLSFTNIATTESYKDKSGEWVNVTTWHKIVGFGYLKDSVSKILKGDKVLVVGTLNFNEWQSEDGKKNKDAFVKVSSLEITPKVAESGMGSPKSAGSIGDMYR